MFQNCFWLVPGIVLIAASEPNIYRVKIDISSAPSHPFNLKIFTWIYRYPFGGFKLKRSQYLYQLPTRVLVVALWWWGGGRGVERKGQGRALWAGEPALVIWDQSEESPQSIISPLFSPLPKYPYNIYILRRIKVFLFHFKK